MTKEPGLPFQCTVSVMALGNLQAVHQSLVLIPFKMHSIICLFVRLFF